MSIQEWAAIAQIVGAVFVVASLVNLALQIRQNTRGLAMSLRSMELAAFERNVESGNRVRELFILNPEVSELYLRGLKSYVDLSGSDKMRFGLALSNVFAGLQGGYIRQLTLGNDPENSVGIGRTVDRLISRSIHKLRQCCRTLSRSHPWQPQPQPHHH